MRHLPVGLLALAATACSGAEPTPIDETPPVATLIGVRPHDGVVALDAGCAAGRAERCDGVDDDCDRRIDEGCPGAGAGALEVAAAWSGPAELRLALIGPADARIEGPPAGACGTANGVARLATAPPSAGAWRLRVERIRACGEGPVTVSASVAVGGQAHGPYNLALAGDAGDLLTLVWE